MILSNSTNKSELDKKSIVTLGDTLFARGFLLASQFCYLVAQVEFGFYKNKSSKLVLLSSSASSVSFEAFATSEAIQCTEIYEYARQLGNPDFVITSFQSYKFLYATRLAEHGRPAEALQYCEAASNILVKKPTLYHPAMMEQIVQLGSMLKFNDPQLLTETEATSPCDPAWLTALKEAVQLSMKQLCEAEACDGVSETAQPPSEFAPGLQYNQQTYNEPQPDVTQQQYVADQQQQQQQYASEQQQQQQQQYASDQQQSPWQQSQQQLVTAQYGDQQSAYQYFPQPSYGEEERKNSTNHPTNQEFDNNLANGAHVNRDNSYATPNYHQPYGGGPLNWQQQQQPTSLPHYQQPPSINYDSSPLHSLPPTNGSSTDYWNQQNNVPVSIRCLNRVNKANNPLVQLRLIANITTWVC